MIDYKDIEAIAARTGIDPEDDRVILALVERGWTYAPASLWGERDDLLLKH